MAKVRTTIYLDSTLRERIRSVEHQLRLPMAAVIMQAIAEYLDKRLINKENKIINK